MYHVFDIYAQNTYCNTMIPICKKTHIIFYVIPDQTPVDYLKDIIYIIYDKLLNNQTMCSSYMYEGIRVFDLPQITMRCDNIRLRYHVYSTHFMTESVVKKTTKHIVDDKTNN